MSQPREAVESASPPAASERVREALAVSLRGCEELLPEADWLKKLVRSEATGQPLRIKLGLDPPRPTSISATRWCSTRCASCRTWGTP